MTIHKLFKELSKVTDEEMNLLMEALREKRNCERLCKDLNVKYSDKRFARFIYERNKTNPQVCAPGQKTMHSPTLKEIELIVCGTNLDIIEEAAEKKGLI